MIFHKFPILLFLLPALSLFYSIVSMGCPSFVDLESLPFYAQYRPMDLYYYSIHGGEVKAPPFRIEPRNKNKAKIFFSHDRWKRASFESTDRIVVDPEDFGELTLPQQIKWPQKCRSPRKFIKITDQVNQNKGAFLLFCGKFSSLPRSRDESSQVVHFQEERIFSSNQYTYQYSQENNLLFDVITEKQNGLPIAQDSDLRVYADIRYFFSMLFESDDIESEIKFIRSDSLGVEAKIIFYLRVLFFRLELSLATDISFYKNSVHIPMVINLPASPIKRLKTGSGIWYFWKFAKDLEPQNFRVHMPFYSKKYLSEFPKQSTLSMAPEVSDRYCLGEVCEFSLEIPFKGQRFIMSFHVPSYLVRDGFFPMFSKSLNEIPSFYEVFQNDRTGLYFETSKLAEGRHPWDYWMRIASPDKKETACPHPILWEEVSLKAF